MAKQVKPKARLSGINTKEVSMVDRAANQRKFLLAKRDTMKKKLVSDGNGGFKEVEIAKASPSEEPQEPQKTEGSAETVSALKAIAQRVIEVGKAVHNGEEIPDGFGNEITMMVAKVSSVEFETDFSKSIDTLKDVLKGLKTEGKPVEKKEELDPSIAKMQKELEELGQTVKAQADTIKKLEEQPAGSNVLQPGNSGGKGDEDDNFWPMDMASDVQKRKEAQRPLS